MKKLLKISLLLLLTSAILLSSIPLAFAGKSIDTYYYWLYADENPTLPFDVGAYKDTHYDNTFYLFLPSEFSGEQITVSSRYALSSVSGALSVDYSANKFVMDASNGASVTVGLYTLTVMRTALPSVSITIDPGYKLDTIHADKEARINAHVRIDGTEDGMYDLASTQIEMKTRGNTTFYFNKKPYQIKFNSKTNLFGMGKAKKWILLANYIDGTGTRNKLSFDLARELGMQDTPDSVFVDLFIDGDYVGNYQLIEKIEVGSSRVNLKDEYGVILEMDSDLRIDSSEIMIRGSFTDKTYVFKDYVTDLEDSSTPEQKEKNLEVITFANNYINDFEETLYDTASSWEDVEKYIDVYSFIRYYFITEIFEQIDCTLASTYFYIDGPGDVLHCGPIWDFDRICGWQNDYDQSWNSDFVKNMDENTDSQRCDLFKQLFRYPEFVKMVNDFYDETAREVLATDKILGMMDGYQEAMWPSLMANFTRWFYVFVDRTTTMDEYGEDTYENQVNYVTNLMKNWIINRNNYMETAFGSHFPFLSYSVYGEYLSDEAWNTGIGECWHPSVSGGCMTYAADVKGMAVSLGDCPVDGSLSFSVYSGGKEVKLSEGEQYIGDSSIVGIKASLTGNLANYFDIEYRVLQARNVQREGFKGWSSWVKNGARAGSTSGSASLYGVNKIQMRLVAKKALEYGEVNLHMNGRVETVSGIIGNYFAPADPEIYGYTFGGWYFTPTFAGTPATTISFGANPMNLYAKLERNAVAGDANGDYRISTADLLYVKYYLAGEYDESDVDVECADLDGDSEVTALDYVLIKKKLLGM